MNERQRVIALFSEGGISTTTDLGRLGYTEVVTRFLRVHELIEAKVRDSLTNHGEQNVDDR
jgi:hypothetical protein